MEEVEEDKPPGRTPFLRIAKLERVLKLKRIFVKFEGAGPTGTQKDRIARLHVLNANNEGYDTISLATCGNYGASLSYFARVYGMKSIIGIPESYTGDRNEEIVSNGSRILQLPGRYEDVVENMRTLSREENWYDCSPGSLNSKIDMEGYEQIAYEIVGDLDRSPSYVSVPMGNGTTISGIFSGFLKMYNRGIIDTLPKFVGSSTPYGNAIVASWKMNSKKILELDPNSIVETPTSEPLVNYRSYDGQRALDSIYMTDGFASYVSDSEMIAYSTLLERYEGLSILPASASSLAAVDKGIKRANKNEDVVVVLTGRGNLWTTQ